MPFLQGWPETDLQRGGTFCAHGHPSCLFVESLSKGEVVVLDNGFECISQEVFVVAGSAGWWVGVYDPLEHHLYASTLGDAEVQVF